MKRVFGLVFALLLIILSVIALGESQAIILPDVIYESLYATSTEELPRILEDYLNEMGGELVDISSKSFEFFNGRIGENHVDYLCYQMFVTEDKVDGSLIYIDILQPFGQTVEESQSYIDTVNYFQSKYGRATGSSIEEIHIKQYGRDVLRWVDKEKNIVVDVVYADGNISEGKSPYIEFALSKNPSK